MSVELLSIELPKAEKNWLRYQAFKQTLRGRSRPSMAEVISTLISSGMQRDPMPTEFQTEDEEEAR